ncbi:MAG: glycosyltransferase family 4 protein [Dehalococcoidia bacterium]
MLNRVAIDASGASSGGAIRYLSQICPALAQAEPGISFYLLNRSAQHDLLPSLPANFQWSPIPDATASLPRRLLWLQTELPKLLKIRQADVLFAASDVTTLRPPCPMVIMAHNFNPFSPDRGQVWSRGQLVRMGLHRWLIRRATRRAARTIFVSQWSREEIAPQLRIPEDRTVVIHHGVDPEFRPADPGSQPGSEPGIILAVSEVLEHKNLQRLVEAYADLVPLLDRAWRLVITGTVSSPLLKADLEALLARRELGDRITFTGFVPKAELADLYRQARILVFPSLVETFGLPLIEAMASGLPVVASHATAIPEVCGDAALYFDPLSVSDMTQAMHRALTDTQLWEDLRQKGLDRAAGYSWDTTAQRLLETLRAAALEAAIR